MLITIIFIVDVLFQLLKDYLGYFNIFYCDFKDIPVHYSAPCGNVENAKDTCLNSNTFQNSTHEIECAFFCTFVE